MMLRSTSIALLFALTVTGCAVSVPPSVEAPGSMVLGLASTYWPPFTAPEGEPRVANELVATALGSDGVQAKEATVPAEGWLASIRDRQFDGSTAVWWSEERSGYLLFSKPYLENRLVLVGRSGSDVTAGSFSELPSGTRIGLVAGYAYGDEVETAQGPEFVEMQSTPVGLRALLADELDYVLADALYARHSLETHPQRDELEVGEVALVFRTLHFAVRKDLPDAQSIIDNFDSRVRQMLRDGTYNRVLGFGWIEADVNGDGHSDLIFQGEHAGSEAPSASYRVETPTRPRPEVELQPDYIINGQQYDGWDNVPDSFKTPGVGGTNIGIGINW